MKNDLSITSFTNARIVLADEIINGSLHACGGKRRTNFLRGKLCLWRFVMVVNRRAAGLCEATA